MSSRRLLSAIAIALLMASTTPLRADGPQTSTLEGRVLDAAGSPLPGVAVDLSGPQGRSSIVTGGDGAFRFTLLVAGDYTLGATLEGLGATEVAVPLGGGERKAVDLALRGTNTESISVSAETPLVNKLEVASTTALETEVTENLSFEGRQYQSSLDAMPGVTHSANSRNLGEVQPAVNGGQWQENAAFVDGVDTSYTVRGGSSRMLLPVTSLSETRLQGAGFEAEYGRVVSGVTSAVIKSGTNQFHGAFLYIPESQKWRAAYDQLDIPRDDQIIDSFETSLGGPIMRDRAWFFASYGNLDTNEADVLADGTLLSTGFQVDAKILKLNFQPSERHQIQLVGVDAPIDKVQLGNTNGDQWSPDVFNLGENLASLTWSYAITGRAFLETKVATQEDNIDRLPLRLRPLTPGANPDWPIGNNFRYQDRNSNLIYNAAASPMGGGYNDTNRQQGNASLSLFSGRNELKFGVDYQDMTSAALNIIDQQFFGRGYNSALPGGFVTPEFKRVFDPSGELETTADVLSAYAQDRFDLGARWNVYLGLRLDDQSFTNDAGDEVNSSTDVAPRLAATFDVGGNGKLLVKGTAGRYYQVTGQDIFGREYATQPNGTNEFSQYRWNASAGSYNIFQQRTVPVLGHFPGDFDPYYKDEASVGLDWQFQPVWALLTRVVAWEVSDTFWSTQQFDAAGQVVADVRNWDHGFRKYDGVQLELNRALRDDWTLRSNYTYSNARGNNYGNATGTLNEDDLFEALGGVEVGTGRTDATSRNRVGRGLSDRKHVLNLIGLKTFPIGEHQLSLGGYFGYRSGERWGRRVNTNVVSPVSGQTIATSTNTEPRDAHALEDTMTLSLTGNWQFPIMGGVAGRVGLEVVNVTNEQELIGINVANGQPVPGRVAYQSPREYRVQVGVTF